MCNDVVIYTDAITNTRSEMTASGVNIPLIVNSSPLRFEVSGNVSANLNTFTHEFTGEYRIYNPVGYDYNTMLSYNGGVDGQIYFIINFGE
jgi:hypothetical protein